MAILNCYGYQKYISLKCFACQSKSRPKITLQYKKHFEDKDKL